MLLLTSQSVPHQTLLPLLRDMAGMHEHSSEVTVPCRSGALDDMQRHGIECLDCYCVDNALVRPGDPLFVGHCWAQQADCGGRLGLTGSSPCLPSLRKSAVMGVHQVGLWTAVDA